MTAHTTQRKIHCERGRLTSVERGGSYVRLRFYSPRIALDSRAGQFVNVLPPDAVQSGYRVLDGQDAEPLLHDLARRKAVVPRPLSFHRLAQDEGYFELLLKVVGPGTRSLAAMEPGQEVQFLGPLGNPLPRPQRGQVLLLAGGIGVAPFLAWASELLQTGSRPIIFFGEEHREDLPVDDELDLLCDFYELSCPMFVTLRREADDRFPGGTPVDLLRACLENRNSSILKTNGEPATIYACGPPKFLEAVGKVANKAGLPAYVLLEEFMGCGFGICNSCVVRVRQEDGQIVHKRACLDGPAFPAKEVYF